jgi:hypothetical protein
VQRPKSRAEESKKEERRVAGRAREILLPKPLIIRDSVAALLMLSRRTFNYYEEQLVSSLISPLPSDQTMNSDGDDSSNSNSSDGAAKHRKFA